jgi:hypothetical protein
MTSERDAIDFIIRSLCLPTQYPCAYLASTPLHPLPPQTRLLDHWDESQALSHGTDGFTQDNRDLLQLMEEAACVRNSNR